MHSVDPPAIVRTIDRREEMIATLKALYREHAQTERRSLADALKLGKLLLVLKGAVPHGQWESLLKQIEIPSQTASKYTRLAQIPPSGISKCESITDALRLLQGPAKSKDKHAKSPYPREKRCRNCRLKNLEKPSCAACKRRNGDEDAPTEWSNKNFEDCLNSLRKMLDLLTIKGKWIDPNTKKPNPPPMIHGLNRLIDQLEADAIKAAKEITKQAEQGLFDQPK